MKTVVFIACVLALVHANEQLNGKIFRCYIEECKKELPIALNQTPMFNELFCAAKKAGVIDKDNVIDRTGTLILCELLVSDPHNQTLCKKNTNICFNEGDKVSFKILRFITIILCVIKQKTLELVDNVDLGNCDYIHINSSLNARNLSEQQIL